MSQGLHTALLKRSVRRLPAVSLHGSIAHHLWEIDAPPHRVEGNPGGVRAASRFPKAFRMRIDMRHQAELSPVNWAQFEQGAPPFAREVHFVNTSYRLD